MITVGELFAGIAGFSRGLEATGGISDYLALRKKRILPEDIEQALSRRTTSRRRYNVSAR